MRKKYKLFESKQYEPLASALALGFYMQVADKNPNIYVEANCVFIECEEEEYTMLRLRGVI